MAYCLFDEHMLLLRKGVWSAFVREGVLPYISYTGMCGPKGMVFEPFWSETGYRFDNYVLKSGLVFKETTRVAQYGKRLGSKHFPETMLDIVYYQQSLNNVDFIVGKVRGSQIKYNLRSEIRGQI